jgi:hypothetical protein
MISGRVRLDSAWSRFPRMSTPSRVRRRPPGRQVSPCAITTDCEGMGDDRGPRPAVVVEMIKRLPNSDHSTSKCSLEAFVDRQLKIHQAVGEQRRRHPSARTCVLRNSGQSRVEYKRCRRRNVKRDLTCRGRCAPVTMVRVTAALCRCRAVAAVASLTVVRTSGSVASSS